MKILEIPTGAIDRSQEMFTEGNPHVTSDPIRVGEIAVVIAKKLASLEPSSQKNI